MQRLSAQPFDDAPLVRTSRDGRGLVIVDRGTEHHGQATVRVRRVALDGDGGFDVHLPYMPLPLPASVIEEQVIGFSGAVLQRMPTIHRTELVSRIRDGLYLPNHAPAVTGALAAQDGTTWLKREQDGRPTARWTILDRQGAVSFELRLPSWAEVMWAEGDLFYTSEPDTDDIPSVVLYRLR